MRSIMIVSLFVSMLCVNAPSFAADDGLAVFKAQKCVECHSINSKGVKAEAAKEQKKDEPTPPDLSGVGLEHNAEWMAKYLKKKEKYEDRFHKKGFRGTDEELKTVTTWMETLKTKTKK